MHAISERDAHLAPFDRDRELLAERVAASCDDALAAGGIAIACARADLAAAIVARLAARGRDVDELRTHGRLIAIDADDCATDPARLDAVVDATRAASPGAPVHVFSELADLDHEIARRTRAERRTEQLLAIAERFAAARTVDDVVAVTLADGAAAVDGASVSLWLVAGDRSTLLGATPGDMWSLDASLAAGVRGGEPVFVGSAAEYRERFPASAAPAAPAMALLPLVGERGVFGAICIGYATERAFAAVDRAFKAMLARQCALALERVDSLAREHQQRRELELLHALTVGASQLDDTGAIFELALDTVERGARCERAGVLLFDAAGVMRWQRAHGLSDAYRTAVAGHSPWPHGARDARPIAVDDVERDPAWASYLPLFRAERIRALAFVPIVHGRELLGKFMLYRDDARAFAERDLRFATQVAVHVGHAVARKRHDDELARAYGEEHAARVAADHARRAREDILSVVSHDLRNPLNAVQLGATALLDEPDGPERVRAIAERIHRQSTRMERLIEDLVDFASVEGGRLVLDRAAHEPSEIIAATADIFAPIARERGVAFEAQALPGLPRVSCDLDRVVQVMSNLVANAISVTPKGGAIAIGARATDDGVVFFARDTGPGIAPDELPNLFERYWRGKQPRYKGTGLGLSIARGIVHAHNGRIWAESRVGAGSTFYFVLSVS